MVYGLKRSSDQELADLQWQAANRGCPATVQAIGREIALRRATQPVSYERRSYNWDGFSGCRSPELRA